MTGIRVGSLFSGYGGLDLALRDVFGDVETAWVSDVCKVDKDGKVGHYEPHRSPCSILSHRLPGAPNLGDIALVDWSTVEPVDVMTGGFPCTDVSTAGKRAGLRPGTRSGLWSHMAYAINQLRPRLVVIENVRGLLSADAHSDLADRPELLDGLRRRDDEPLLRALGAVLGDLADIGYDAAWCGLRAADVGAAHGRFRVFVVAYPRGVGWDWRPGGVRDGRDSTIGQQAGDHASDGRRQILPTPRATDGTHGGPNQRGSSGDLMLSSAVSKLLPTPAVNDMGAGKTVEAWDEWTAKMQAAHGNGNGHGASLHVEALRLLPTPRTVNNENRQSEGYGGKDGNFHGLITGQSEWGDYAAAIARQEQAFGRPAPDPTETAPKGGRRLSCRFDEWLMGLPDGWITDVPGIKHNETLKACGNGVVPQQAAAAIRWLLGVIASEVAA